MIISASRRTDIPAFHSEWMMNRLREGYALIPNPYNAGRRGRVELSPEVTDCIVFWTKNPGPMLGKLKEIEALGFSYYFEFTLTGYGTDLEPGLMDKERLWDIFSRLSGQAGPERVDWRFDPIIITDKYPASWHKEQFASMCEKMQGRTKRCIISFVDEYAHLGKSIRAPEADEIEDIALSIGKTAEHYGIPVYTCAEASDLSRYGIQKGACIDQNKIEEILGCCIDVKKDTGQRKECGCIASVDIGAYDTCAFGCTYCYANTRAAAVRKKFSACDPLSPMLGGWPRGDEIITKRTAVPVKTGQLKLLL